jgi:hypothetical protein
MELKEQKLQRKSTASRQSQVDMNSVNVEEEKELLGIF